MKKDSEWWPVVGIILVIFFGSIPAVLAVACVLKYLFS